MHLNGQHVGCDRSTLAHCQISHWLSAIDFSKLPSTLPRLFLPLLGYVPCKFARSAKNITLPKCEPCVHHASRGLLRSFTTTLEREHPCCCIYGHALNVTAILLPDSFLSSKDLKPFSSLTKRFTTMIVLSATLAVPHVEPCSDLAQSVKRY